MSKLSLIIRREYLTRVRKRSFLLSTFLTPIGFVIFFAVVVLIFSSGSESQRIALLDPDNTLQLEAGKRSLPNNETVSFIRDETDLKELKQNYESKDYDGILVLPPRTASDSIEGIRNLSVQYYSKNKLGINTQGFIKKVLKSHLKDLKMEALGIEERLLEKLETEVVLTPNTIGAVEEQDQVGNSSSVILSTALGGIMGFLIYIVIFIYGSMVMRSVMEEKNNRIVEVIISSVKPFQLMLGKIVGVGLVGLTQFAIWLVTFPLLYLLLGLIFGGQLQEAQQMSGAQGEVDQEQVLQMVQAMEGLGDFNYFKIITLFLLFFIAGYLLYASLFAAVGSALGDDLGEGQSLTLPIIIPVIIAFYIAIAVVENPNSSLALWSSQIPLFSPIIMPARLAFDPPWWEIILSLSILYTTCFFFIWLSGRIYRIGILMYGKKVTLREMGRWLFRD